MSIELPNFPNIPGSPRWVEVAQARERILLDRIAELEADAERYRWLRSEETGDWEVQSLILPLGAGQYTILEGEELDAAIDAALEAK